MKKTTAQKISVTVPKGAKNIRVEVCEESGQVDIFYNFLDYKEEKLDEYFPIVRASELSLEDDFLQYEPKTSEQKEFKERLIEAINSGLFDFRAPAMDPSFDKNGNICYEAGKMPAVGKSAEWWFENAKKFMPEKNSRQGLTKEHDAFLAVLIKFLIEEWGYSKAEAWKAICDDSRKLGHYWNSVNAKHKFEPTGSRKVGEHCDLANTYKITADDLQGFRFSLVGGNYSDNSVFCPLADVNHIFSPDNCYNHGVGWLVLDV